MYGCTLRKSKMAAHQVVDGPGHIAKDPELLAFARLVEQRRRDLRQRPRGEVGEPLRLVLERCAGVRVAEDLTRVVVELRRLLALRQRRVALEPRLRGVLREPGVVAAGGVAHLIGALLEQSGVRLYDVDVVLGVAAVEAAPLLERQVGRALGATEVVVEGAVRQALVGHITVKVLEVLGVDQAHADGHGHPNRSARGTRRQCQRTLPK